MQAPVVEGVGDEVLQGAVEFGGFVSGDGAGEEFVAVGGGGAPFEDDAEFFVGIGRGSPGENGGDGGGGGFIGLDLGIQVGLGDGQGCGEIEDGGGPGRAGFDGYGGGVSADGGGGVGDAA